MATTLKCWRFDCVAGVSTDTPITHSGDYKAKGGVIHVGWHNGRLLTTASCTQHMTEQAIFEWDLYAKKHGEAKAEERYGKRPEFTQEE